MRGFWGGRFKDLLVSQGVRFQAAEVERALRAGAPEAAEPSLEYVIVRPDPAADGPLAVRVEAGAATTDPDALAARCRAAIREHVGLDARVEILERESLPRSGYKASRVVDN